VVRTHPLELIVDEEGLMLIALEGIDASGKQTQTKLLKEKLASHFAEVATFDFPHYESVAGGLIGRVLRGETIVANQGDQDRLDYADGSELHAAIRNLKSGWSLDKALLIQCAMLVNRFEHFKMLERYSEDDDRLLILDRYYLSGLVYGQADGLDRDWLYQIHAALPDPDLFFILDIPVEESVRRRPERRDYYEKNIPKLRRVRQLYLEEAATDPGGTIVIDGTKPPEEITEMICAAVARKVF
jgi:dTMP kinase